MTIRIAIKNLDTETKRIVQVKQSDGYVHNIEAGTEKEFHVHADNSFQITEGGNPSAETAVAEPETQSPAPETQEPEAPVENPESTNNPETEEKPAEAA